MAKRKDTFAQNRQLGVGIALAFYKEKRNKK